MSNAIAFVDTRVANCCDLIAARDTVNVAVVLNGKSVGCKYGLRI